MPGAFSQIDDFLKEALNTDQVDAYLGSLSSAFIVGYAVTGLFAANLVHRYPPFKVMSIGLIIWVIAVLLTSVSPTYWMLLLSRGLSGVGEASFQCVVPPFIDDNAPAQSRSLWLALFYMCIPVGTAAGFGWGGALGGAVGWRNAFRLEAPFILPVAILVWFLPYHRGTRAAELAESEERTEEEAGLIADAETLDEAPVDGVVARATHRPSVLEEFCIVMSSAPYVCVSFGYAAYTFVLGGLASFGPLFFYYLGLFSNKSTASIAFGGLIAGAGMLATPFGGWLMDLRQKGVRKSLDDAALAADAQAAGGMVRSSPDAAVAGGVLTLNSGEDDDAHSGMVVGDARMLSIDAPRQSAAGGTAPPATPYDDTSVKQEVDATSTVVLDAKMMTATPQMALCATIGMGVALITPFVTENTAAAFFTLAFSSFCLFTTTAATNIAVMATVPAAQRPFAIALATIIQHAFGDVPSPTIIGAIADRLSPTHKVDGVTTRPKQGLRYTLLFTLLMLVFAAVLWIAAWFFSRQRALKHISSGVYRKEREARKRLLSDGAAEA